MSATRALRLVVCAILVMAVVLVALSVRSSGTTDRAEHGTYVGMGDLRRFEWETSREDPVVVRSNPGATGMGDLRRFEWETSREDRAVTPSNPGATGMGELRRFEAQQK